MSILRPTNATRATLADRRGILLVCCALLALLLVPACSGGSSGDKLPPGEATIIVKNSAGMPIAGATVYLIPALMVNGSEITTNDILNGSAENRDEPLEDLARNPVNQLRSAMTDAEGRAHITGVGLGDYFWYVEPNDGEHLPGGAGCRVARKASTFLGLEMNVALSSSAGPNTPFTGSQACLNCHPSYASHGGHAHKLGFTVPGQLSAMQDTTAYPRFTDGLELFISTSSYLNGTPVYFYDFDPSRGADKYKTSLSDPSGSGGTVHVIAWLWQQDTTGDYKITLESTGSGPGVLINPEGIPGGGTMELDVELAYGGAMNKRNYLVQIPGLPGLYPFLQYQIEGDEARFDRTRKLFRDLHLDWFFDINTQSFQNPPLNSNFEASCTACHSTGYQRYQDPGGSGAWLSGAVADANGPYDINGDGMMDEINVGCESCHGPGFAHALWASDPNNAGMEARYIVRPDLLSPSRETLLCGRCHDRVQGVAADSGEQPLNAQGDMVPVGISRHTYLNEYVSRKGPEVADYWPDGIHARNHYQQYSDMVRSVKHRNSRILTTCTDCHNSHGESVFRGQLVEDPDDPNGRLCANCHGENHIEHIVVQTGFTHSEHQTSCADCHMAETARSGSGRYGSLLQTPTGTALDVDRVYHSNDIHSHLFPNVPRKTHPGTAGETPIDAMPVPYTNSCGSACHQPASIPFITPGLPSGPDPNVGSK